MRKSHHLDEQLYQAASSEDLNLVKKLCKGGANISIENSSPIRYAAGNGHLEVVRFLISQGSSTDDLIFHGLRWALSNQNYEIVKILYEASNPKPSGPLLGREFGVLRDCSPETFELAKYFTLNAKGFVKELQRNRPGFEHNFWGDLACNPLLPSLLDY